MCGLAGFAGAGDREDIVAMTAALRHRGPDGEGFHIDAGAGIFLGHRRLAILDIAQGQQPMWNEDATVCVIFNGEIYNHGELRAELERRGHVFRSHHSDTEVLVHGYEEWGNELPGKLNGMFAFAIYDKPRKRFFLARDRFGEKPLYYFHGDGLFAFASELNALAMHRACDRNVDQRALQKFFAYGFIPAPNCLLRRCRKLPGGCHLTYDLAGGTLTTARYWQFRIETDERLNDRGEEDLAGQLRHLLDVAVQRRLISDVPLGIFLSGGIDSSAVLAFAAQHLPADGLKTFTIGFKEKSFDESPYARRMASTVGCDHREDILEMQSMLDVMPEVLARLGEPLGDPSVLPTYLLSAFTRRHVTVALSGDGGDELFAGYDTFQALGPAEIYDRVVAAPLHRCLRGVASRLPVSARNMSMDFKLRRSLSGLSYRRPFWNPVWLAPVEPALMAELFAEPLAAEELYDEALSCWDQSGSANLGDKTLEFYTNFYLQEDILAKVDRTSMMSSLETRAVFLDNDVVDFCRRLPYRLKYRNGTRKYLLKRALDGMVPDSLIHRRKKGFGIPLVSWLREMPDALPLDPVSGANAGWVKRCWQEHRAGDADHRLLLWSWLSLQYAQRGLKRAAVS